LTTWITLMGAQLGRRMAMSAEDDALELLSATLDATTTGREP
jgi:hypothetical protein